jgi:hypothetical protein
MKLIIALLLSASGPFTLVCCAQQTLTQIPDAPTAAAGKPANAGYTPPTQGERFKSYLRQSYGWKSLVEAGVHAGIAQARDSPSEWPEGGQGFADRYGSAMGEIAVRGTTEYVLANVFSEDIRTIRCSSPCLKSRFQLAFENTFEARKGDDGHETLSVARFVSPFSGSAVAVNTWYPAGAERVNIAKEAGACSLGSDSFGT